MITVGVQRLEQLENWMEVRKINQPRLTKVKGSGIVTQRSIMVSLREVVKEALICLIQDFFICVHGLFSVVM